MPQKYVLVSNAIRINRTLQSGACPPGVFALPDHRTRQQIIDHYPGEPAANISQYIWLKTLLVKTTRADYQCPGDIKNHSILVFLRGFAPAKY